MTAKNNNPSKCSQHLEGQKKALKDKPQFTENQTIEKENDEYITKFCLNFVRIGCHYYKIQYYPLQSGDTQMKLELWYAATIKEDLKTLVNKIYGGQKGFNIKQLIDSFYSEIRKFHGFVTIPNHIKHLETINGFYNRYEQFEHVSKAGECPTSLAYIKHIFGEQYEVGLDYMTILFLKPLQILPILCLVSEARGTGKTTFLMWLKAIYKGNMTINTNDDFRSQFNSDWAGKLIIAVDETFLDRKEDSERIKNLSTARTYKSEAKGKDRQEVEFFGKIILCSNNEDRFVHIDNTEIRYWVRQIAPLPENLDFKNRDALTSQLISEIPAFLHYLKKRPLSTENHGRMWFKNQDIHTPALDKLRKGNRSLLEQNLSEWLLDKFIEFGQDELHYTLNDLIEILPRAYRADTASLKRIICDKWNMTAKNVNRETFISTKTIMGAENGELLDFITQKKRGRFFTFKRSQFLEQVTSKEQQ